VTERYFSTFQLFLLTLFAALIVVAKIALHLPLQLSGHTGIFWMAIIIVAARIVPKRGAASLVGLTSGIMAAFLGMGDLGGLNTLISYVMAGVGVDLALLLLRDPENIACAVLAGMFGHLCKYMVKWVFSMLAGAPVGFVALGVVKALFGYILFGGLGGLLGALTIRALNRAGFFTYMQEKK
jgi:ABC-type thiamin/hydroxymethylpyrimidine transport system permease subunit